MPPPFLTELNARLGSLGCACGVACNRQFLSRTRWRRTSLAGVRAVEAGGRGANGEESGVGEPLWARGVEGRVEVEGSSV